MTRSFGAIAALLLVLVGAARADGPAGPDPSRLRDLVARLAAPDLGGRATPDARERTAALLADAMRAAGLVPVPGRDDLVLPVKARVGVPAGRHVLGWRPGREADAGYVLVVAGYDGRPAVGGRAVPGADGNGTGVAALVEAGRLLVAGDAPRRGVLLAALDLSEHGREGSRHLAQDPPLDLARCAAVVDVEHLGRSLGDAFPQAVFVFGSVEGGVRRAAAALAPPAGMTVRALGIDLCPLAETDALAFEAKGVPTAVVTAGPSRDDGTPADTAEKVDATALAARTRVLAAFLRALADAPSGPAAPVPADPGEDLPVLREVLEDVAARAESLGFTSVGRLRAKYAAAFVGDLVAKGKATAGDRTAARVLALDVLGRLAEPR